MLHIAAHGRDHLFHVQADGKFVWRAHQDDGTWKAEVLCDGADPAQAPAVWPEGTVVPAQEAPDDTYLQAACQLVAGGTWHGWMAAGQPWELQTWPAV